MTTSPSSSTLLAIIWRIIPFGRQDGRRHQSSRQFLKLRPTAVERSSDAKAKSNKILKPLRRKIDGSCICCKEANLGYAHRRKGYPVAYAVPMTTKGTKVRRL